MFGNSNEKTNINKITAPRNSSLEHIRNNNLIRHSKRVKTQVLGESNLISKSNNYIMKERSQSYDYINKNPLNSSISKCNISEELIHNDNSLRHININKLENNSTSFVYKNKFLVKLKDNVFINTDTSIENQSKGFITQMKNQNNNISKIKQYKKNLFGVEINHFDCLCFSTTSNTSAIKSTKRQAYNKQTTKRANIMKIEDENEERKIFSKENIKNLTTKFDSLPILTTHNNQKTLQNNILNIQSILNTRSNTLNSILHTDQNHKNKKSNNNIEMILKTIRTPMSKVNNNFFFSHKIKQILKK